MRERREGRDLRKRCRSGRDWKRRGRGGDVKIEERRGKSTGEKELKETGVIKSDRGERQRRVRREKRKKESGDENER